MQYKTIIIPSFSGGLNKHPDVELLKEDQACILTDAFPRYPGSLTSRRFAVKQHASVLGAQVHGVIQHLGTPLIVVKAGSSLFDNFVSVGSSLSATGLMSALSHNKLLYLIDTQVAKKYNRTTGTLYNWGLAAPTAAPTSAQLAAGNLNGTYQYKVTYINGDIESLDSAASIALAVVNKSVTVSDIPISPDAQCTGRHLYRMGGTTSVYNLITAIGDNVTTSYVDDTLDANVGDEILVSTHHEPPTTCQLVTFHFLRAYMCGDSTVGQENWVWFSEDYGADPFAIEYWGPYPYENYIQLGGTEKITSMLSMFRMLLAFKENEIFSCEGTIPDEMFITKTPATRGCVAPLGSAFVGQAIYPYWDGVYFFDGRDSQKLVEFTDPMFDTEVDKDYLNRAIGLGWKGKYLLSFPEVGYTYPNKILIINMAEGKGRFLLDIPATSFGVDTKGELWCGESTGWVTKLEQAVNTDGESLNMVYRSKKFALGETPGDVGPMATMFFRGMTGTSGATLRVYLDGVCVLEKGFKSTSMQTFRQKLPPRFGRYIQIEFEYTGQDEFRIAPPIIINPREGMI